MTPPKINGEPTNRDILTALNSFSAATDQRFDRIENDIKAMKGDIKTMKGDISTVKGRMVTKDYLDDKLADLKGDLVVLVRKEDRKLASLIDVLIRKSVITADDARQILALEPFLQS